ncbi:MAG: DUF4007 family protein [Bacteroidota bacterium]|nr:DUF4007 family protein [Bacteroidota bacterium]MXW15298.1 DUF4007 family protein [Rhodothermaceae bacterium]MDE2646328.1 DUF4007 family protein [Bacteroidota bacterium]MXW33617.1 DUF4007 family protein [Rhodothermaceae bacterium]MYC05316.1 DUF4007 family protein [Rhodothermaceae bacterium]
MASTYSFSGHETFPLRLNWLKKAVNAVNNKDTIFHSDEAIVEFGVGKNMVRSIRHWALSTEVIERDADTKKQNSLRVSEFGEYLLGDQGVDPYCEDVATLWLLHWLLCRSPRRSTLWHFIFGHWRGGALELRNLRPILKRWIDEREGNVPSDATLRRDFQCFRNTYITPRLFDSHVENIVAYPLISLGLLYENGGMVYLREGQSRSLPSEIFAYAVLDYWDREFFGMETISAQDLIIKQASPGQIFLLSEEQAFELVDRIEAFKEAPFRFDSTAGVHQFYRTPGATPQAMLEHYYSNGRITVT